MQLQILLGEKTMLKELELEVLKYASMVERREEKIKKLKNKIDKLTDLNNRMNCWNCGDELIWGGDHDFDAFHINGEGIVANFTCSNPNCNTYVESYYTISEE